MLAALASELMGKKVAVDRFQTYQSDKAFDAIWVCASLLHVPLIELPTLMCRTLLTLRLLQYSQRPNKTEQKQAPTQPQNKKQPIIATS
jgi:hypothetical protein